MVTWPAPAALFLLSTMAIAVPARGQVRAFPAVRLIQLQAESGAEGKPFRELVQYLRNTDHLAEDAADIKEETRSGFARCIVRTNLPRPRSLALECYDFAGRYFGTLRAKGVGDMSQQLFWTINQGMPAARPLTTFTYIYLQPIEKAGYPWAAAYVADLVKQNGSLILVNSPEAVPPGDREQLAYCEILPEYAASGGPLFATTLSGLVLRDEAGATVRRINGGALSARRSLANAVKALFYERDEDRETYGPPPKAR